MPSSQPLSRHEVRNEFRESLTEFNLSAEQLTEVDKLIDQCNNACLFVSSLEKTSSGLGSSLGRQVGNLLSAPLYFIADYVLPLWTPEQVNLTLTAQSLIYLCGELGDKTHRSFYCFDENVTQTHNQLLMKLTEALNKKKPRNAENAFALIKGHIQGELKEVCEKAQLLVEKRTQEKIAVHSVAALTDIAHSSTVPVYRAFSMLAAERCNEHVQGVKEIYRSQQTQKQKLA